MKTPPDADTPFDDPDQSDRQDAGMDPLEVLDALIYLARVQRQTRQRPTTRLMQLCQDLCDQLDMFVAVEEARKERPSLIPPLSLKPGATRH